MNISKRYKIKKYLNSEQSMKDFMTIGTEKWKDHLKKNGLWIEKRKYHELISAEMLLPKEVIQQINKKIMELKKDDK